jgi:hypothetical protein
MFLRIVRNIGGFYDLDIPGTYGEQNNFLGGHIYLKLVKRVVSRGKLALIVYVRMLVNGASGIKLTFQDTGIGLWLG